jgi:hypothetical protein
VAGGVLILNPEIDDIIGVITYVAVSKKIIQKNSEKAYLKAQRY